MPPRIVETTSPPGNQGAHHFEMAAMRSHRSIVMAREPTAGPTLIGDIIGANIHHHVPADHGGNDQMMPCAPVTQG